MRRAPHIKQNEKTFRAMKRLHFKYAMMYFKSFMFGSVYLPAGSYLEVTDALQHLRKAHAILKPWWKKAYYRIGK